MIHRSWASLACTAVLAACVHAGAANPFEEPSPGARTIAVMVRNWDYADVGVEIGSPTPEEAAVVGALSTQIISAERPTAGALKLRLLFANVDGPRTLTDFVAVAPGERIQLTIHDSSDRFEPGFRPYSIRTW